MEKELLKKIAFQLSGMEWADLSQAERNIAKTLITHGYLRRNTTEDLDTLETP